MDGENYQVYAVHLPTIDVTGGGAHFGQRGAAFGFPLPMEKTSYGLRMEPTASSIHRGGIPLCVVKIFRPKGATN